MVLRLRLHIHPTRNHQVGARPSRQYPPRHSLPMGLLLLMYNNLDHLMGYICTPLITPGILKGLHQDHILNTLRTRPLRRISNHILLLNCITPSPPIPHLLPINISNPTSSHCHRTSNSNSNSSSDHRLLCSRSSNSNSPLGTIHR